MRSRAQPVRSCTALISPSDQVVRLDVSPEVISPVERWISKHRCDGHRFPLPTARLVAARLRRFGGLERYAVRSPGQS